MSEKNKNEIKEEIKIEKTYEEINQKITSGEAVVVTAEEMIKIVEEHGVKYAAKKVDVVTTGTFGAMCSSGAFFNIGQPDPPIKMEKVFLNGVEAYHGNAAADFYLGVTKSRSLDNFDYGGGHVLEDLLKGESIRLTAEAYGTDCYPRKTLEVNVNLQDFNQAILLNPRNSYERYVCAVNSSDRAIYTYMGKLLPNFQNGTFGGAGELSPLIHDPGLQTIGVGTNIFLGGTQGLIIGEGTQHNPGAGWSNLMVKGDLKKMDPDFISGAAIKGYGNSCFVGIGVPIPVINEDIARSCAIKDENIFTDVVDYSTGELNRPVLRKVNYAELKSGTIDLEGRKINVAATSSIYKARIIADTLKKWIQEGTFTLNKPWELLSTKTKFRPLEKEYA
ncbi:MAG: homocysteine biosynthesis protein [Promethearchaeota archaeon]